MDRGNTTTQPWDARLDESSKAYEAFSIYRDMGIQRTLGKVAAKLKKSDTLIARWSRTYGWVERAAAWDAEQDRLQREEIRKLQIEEIKKMRKRHAKLASDMLVKAAKALQKIPEEEIKPVDVSRMVETASKLERISRGDVGEVIEERVGESAPSPVTFYMPSNSREDSGGNDEE